VHEPKVSIIIVTCDRPFLVKSCIERVLQQPYPHKEVIVVDSSSNDKTEQVMTAFPDVISLRIRGQRDNRPQAKNEGMTAVTGDIVAFIDDDSMVHPGWLAALLDAYQDRTVGGVGGRVIQMPEPYCDQDSGSPRLFVRPSGRVIGKDTGLESKEVVEVDHLIGCNMSFRREALEQVGGFDTNYTLTSFREETDLCIRVQRVGWRILFVPSMAVTHFSPRSVQKPYFLEQPKFQYSNGRNSTYFAIKLYGLNPRTLGGQLIVDTGKYCGRAVYFSGIFMTGAAAHLVGRVAGLATGVAWMLSKRRQEQANPKIIKRIQPVDEQLSSPIAPQSEAIGVD
jgi:GT2 family glycosyltransferase